MAKDVEIIDTITKRLNVAKVKYGDAQEQALQQNAFDLEKEATNLAPEDEGALKDDITAGRVKRKKDGMEVTVGANKSYAAKVHELMPPAVGATMRPGPTTKARPPTRFGKAGGKYLQRPMFGKSEEWTAHIAKTMKAVK